MSSLKGKLDAKIENHREKYIHVPKSVLLPFLGIFLFSFLTWVNLKLLDLDLMKMVFSGSEAVQAYSFHPSQLIQIYPVIFEYIFISGIIISIFAFFKGGYNELKTFEEGGLIFAWIGGLGVGLTGGLGGGLAGGLTGGLGGGLIWGLVWGLVLGLIGGLVLGLVLVLLGELS